MSEERKLGDYFIFQNTEGKFMIACEIGDKLAYAHSTEYRTLRSARNALKRLLDGVE